MSVWGGGGGGFVNYLASEQLGEPPTSLKGPQMSGSVTCLLTDQSVSLREDRSNFLMRNVWVVVSFPGAEREED